MIGRDRAYMYPVEAFAILAQKIKVAQLEGWT